MKYLVISTDMDKQLAYLDLVIASDSDEAAEMVADVRQYCQHSEALSLAELELHATLLEQTPAGRIAETWEDTVEAHRAEGVIE